MARSFSGKAAVISPYRARIVAVRHSTAFCVIHSEFLHIRFNPPHLSHSMFLFLI